MRAEDQWLEDNLCDNKVYHASGVCWNVVFAATLWNMWRACKKLQFENDNTNRDPIALKSIIFAKEISSAFQSNLNRDNRKNHALIKWSFPPSGRIKINTDGSAVDHGWASFGGLACDDQGRWIEGFCGRIGYDSPLKAELWGIKRGLKLAKDRGWKKPIIETDCEMALDLIETGEIENHPEKIIIDDCHLLVKETEV